MFILGLQGSPRKKGNTQFLLSKFLEESQKWGARTQMIEVCQKKIEPCQEYILCEKKGICPIDDDMKHEIYPLLRKADVIVAATPIFFYNTTAQLKSLIDRSQTLWARKYKLHLTDPNRKWRKGFTLAVGATRGKNLFEGLYLTMNYFFDAVGAAKGGSLVYREIEKPGDMDSHPSVRDDIRSAVATLMESFQGRKKILFTGKENACRTQMASAFAQYLAGDKLDVYSAGSQPADKLDSLMVQVMHEKGMDMAFRQPVSLSDTLSTEPFDFIVSMDHENIPDVPSNVRHETWGVTIPADLNQMRVTRDSIETKVMHFVENLA